MYDNTVILPELEEPIRHPILPGSTRNDRAPNPNFLPR